MSTTINNTNTTKNFIPYGTDPEMDKLVDSEDCEERDKAVRQGYGLDKLITDPDYLIRSEVALHGYGLDKLINDPSKFVRESANILLDSIEFDKHTDEVMGIINETENMLDELLASL